MKKFAYLALCMMMFAAFFAACGNQPADSTYKVEHYQQNLEGNEYTLVDQQELTGKVGEKTNAKAKTYEGFTAKQFEQQTISEDGSTVVKIYYDRKVFTVTWKNGDTILKKDEGVRYGATPAYTGDTPTKEGNAQYSYTFSGWTPEIVAVTEDAVYSATFTQVVNKYTVTWKDADGNVLEVDEVEYGQTPSFDGELPEPPEPTAEFTYSYKWDKEIGAVEGDVEYRLVVVSTKNKYKVTFNGENEIELEYGSKVEAPTAPVQPGYDFDGWYNGDAKWDFDNDIVTGNLNLTAKFVVKAMVNGDDYSSFIFGAYAQTGEYKVAAVKESDTVISYSISGNRWDIYLPKVKYADYYSVSFKIFGEGWFGMGYDGQNISHGPQEGILVVTNDGNGVFSVNMTVKGSLFGEEKTFYYSGTLNMHDNAAILNGEQSLALMAECYDGSHKIYVEVPQFGLEPPPLPTLGDGDIFTDVFGAKATFDGGAINAYIVDDYTIGYDFSDKTEISATVFLPRIKYSDYKTVTFEMTDNGWTMLGYEGQMNLSQGGNSATLVITNNENGTYSVVMTVNTDGATHEYYGTLSEEQDSAVINGQEGLKLDYLVFAPYRNLKVSLPTFTK